MTPDQLDKLKILAERATPGPWVWERYSGCVETQTAKRIVTVDSESCFRDKIPTIGAYIAAVSPDVLLRLIDELVSLRSKIGETELLTEMVHKSADSEKYLFDELQALRAEVKRLNGNCQEVLANERALLKVVDNLRAQLAEAREVIDWHRDCKYGQCQADELAVEKARAYPLEKYK